MTKTFDSRASWDISFVIWRCNCAACMPRLRWNELTATLLADDVEAFVIALDDGDDDCESAATAPTKAPSAAIVDHR